MLARISEEAYTEPGILKTGPHRSVCHRIVPHDFDDPAKWAITWRLYKRKHLDKQ